MRSILLNRIKSSFVLDFWFKIFLTVSYTVLFTQCTIDIHAQDGSLDINFNPSADLYGSKTIEFPRASAVQPDGKIIIGGRFTHYKEIPRNSIVRINSDGSLDTTFNPGTGLINNWGVGSISAIALQLDGKIIITGDFTQYNGIACNNIARINSNGSFDNTFDPGNGFISNETPNSIVIQSDGKIIIGGGFTQYDETPRNNIARINNDGSLDDTFDPGTGASGIGIIETLALQPDGKIIIAGGFTQYNEIPSNRIARINSDGSLDDTFDPGTGPSGSVLQRDIYTLALQPDGKIIIGGAFTGYNGTFINRIARINADGSIDDTFNPGTGATGSALQRNVYSIALQPDGKIIIGGNFTHYNGIDCNSIARVNSDGSHDNSFEGSATFYSITSEIIASIIFLSDGKIFLQGTFSEFNGVPRNGLARINSDGSLDNSFETGAGIMLINMEGEGEVLALDIQPDGKIVIGGHFTNHNGIIRYNIARFNADGSLDTDFDPALGPNGRVRSIAIQADGKILISGSFNYYNNTPRNGIARINSDGSLDNSFDPGIGITESLSFAQINSFVLQPDGKILIGGSFTNYNGIERNRIARINADGSLDESFNPGSGIITIISYTSNAMVETIALQDDGKILIGGYFNQYNGDSRVSIARINADGSLDDTFNPGTGAWVDSLFLGSIKAIVLQPDGKIIIGGNFTQYNDIPRNRLVRINADGSLDDTFDIGTGVVHEEAVQANIGAIFLQPDGKIIVGGLFIQYNETFENGIARINPDGSSDISFNPGTGFDLDLGKGYGHIDHIAKQSSEKIVLLGRFFGYDDYPIRDIVRLNLEDSVTSVFNLIDPDMDVHVYPNPYHDVTNFSVQSSQMRQVVSEFFDMSGRLILSRTYALNAGENLISFGEGLSHGVYLVRISESREGEVLSTLKLIKQ